MSSTYTGTEKHATIRSTVGAPNPFLFAQFEKIAHDAQTKNQKMMTKWASAFIERENDAHLFLELS